MRHRWLQNGAFSMTKLKRISELYLHLYLWAYLNWFSIWGIITSVTAILKVIQSGLPVPEFRDISAAYQIAVDFGMQGTNKYSAQAATLTLGRLFIHSFPTFLPLPLRMWCKLEHSECCTSIALSLGSQEEQVEMGTKTQKALVQHFQCYIHVWHVW